LSQTKPAGRISFRTQIEIADSQRAATTSSMSVGSKSLPARRRGNEGHENGDGAAVREEEGDMATGGGGSRSRKQKAKRYDRWFSGLELSIGPGSLKDVDAGKLKGQIKKWAKAVVAFARQISFGSPRSARTPGGGGGGDDDDTPRSAPSSLRASRSSSRLGARGGAKEGAFDVRA
jgi:hypothetical protein